LIIEDKDVLQAVATVIAGIIIFLTLERRFKGKKIVQSPAYKIQKLNEIDDLAKEQLKAIFTNFSNDIKTQEDWEKARPFLAAISLSRLSDEYVKYIELKTYEGLATVLMFILLIASIISLLFNFDDLLLGLPLSRILFAAGLIAMLFRITLYGRR
jgi:hypothetical protein